MANILCPWCGCPIAVDRGIRRRGIVYCCRGCAASTVCEIPGCARGTHPSRPPDVSLPETRNRMIEDAAAGGARDRRRAAE